MRTVRSKKRHTSCVDPLCEVCRHNRTVKIPDELIEALASRQLVLFVGAGVGTEGSAARPSNHRLYNKVAAALNIADDTLLPFPELMSRYCDEHGGRRKLAALIRSHLEYGRVFPEVFTAETQFHRALSTVPMTDEIFTTNWDEYFESVCYATPFVTGEDFAYWTLSGRRVFKLHGSINNIGSIVATKEEYDACYTRLQQGALGAALKMALATKTLLFLGYSFRDEDFQRLWSLIVDDLGFAGRKCYWVTIDSTLPAHIPAESLHILQTDATHFIRQLKEILVDDGVMIPDDRWERVLEFRGEIEHCHLFLSSHYSIEKTPEIIYTFAHQDGLMHACDWLLSRAAAGQASHTCFVTQKLQWYEERRKERLQSKQYGEVAYIQGFMDGLLLAIVDEDEFKFCPRFLSLAKTGR